MIFKIAGKDSKAFSQDIKNVLKYSENKKEKGVGELIYNNTFSDEIKEIAQAFEDAMDTNPNIQKEKLLHISASLPLGETISNEQFVQVSLNYLEKMGYVNTPTVIYRHTEQDKKEHVHLVLSNISFEGKKLSKFNDFYKSQKVSREIEKEFGLTQTEYKREKNQERLNEINVRKYRISISIEKALKSPLHLAKLTTLAGASLTNFEGGKSDKALILSLGKEYSRVLNYLHNNELVYYTEKEQFVGLLDKTLKSSISLEDYFKNLEENNVYWDLKLLSGRTTLTYGISKNSYYVQEKQLPNTFSYESLEKGFAGKSSSKEPALLADPKNQRDYLRQNLKRAIRSSRNIEQLSSNLELRGISIQYERNSAGIYGASLWSNTVEHPEKYKASEIDRLLSWKNIQQALQDNDWFLAKSDKPENVPTSNMDRVGAEENNVGQAPDLSKLGKSFEGEDDSSRKKKKKKGDEEEERGLNI